MTEPTLHSPSEDASVLAVPSKSSPRPPGEPVGAKPSTKIAERPEERGATFIDDEVISIIARTAAERVEGVHRLGGSSLRALLDRFGRSGGVESEVGMQEAAVDIEVVVDLGYSIRDVARAIRRAVIETLERTTGRRVVEVNVYVVDVHAAKHEHKVRRVE